MEPKTLRNRKGAVLMYVVMALTVVAAIGISITLVATNLFSRTATKASDQQAYLLAKSIAQCFAAEETYSVRNIVEYLHDNPTEKVTAKASVYYDPSTMATAQNVNIQYLTGLNVTDAYMTFYLSDKEDFLYGDVTVSYNGAIATATLVMSCLNVDGFESNMADLFDTYDIFATQPNGLSFNMSTTTNPEVCLYNDSDTMAVYSLEQDINAKLTMTGPFAVKSSNTATRKITGTVSSYGDLQLLSYINLPSGSGALLEVNGDLVIGKDASTVCTVSVARDIFGLSDVNIITKKTDTNTIVSGTIYSQGNVSLINAHVKDVCATSGSVTVQGGEVANISTQGTVILTNCRVTGNIYAGKLKVTNSTILGNVTVQGSSVVSANSIMPNGDAEIQLGASATSDCQIGQSISNNFYCSGNLKVANYSPTLSLTLYGNIEVGGGLSDPVVGSYPYLTEIVGNLRVHGGIRTAMRGGLPSKSEYYDLAYLIGLSVRSTNATTGNVVLDWSVPVFVGRAGLSYYASEGSSASQYASILDATRRTEIQNTLYVCTNGAKTDGMAGSFSLFKHYGSRADKRADVYSDIFLNGAVLTNIMVGSASTYGVTSNLGDLAVWGGTIKGNVLAHDILLSDVYTDNDSQCFYARTSSGSPGYITLGALTDTSVIHNTAKDVVNSASTFNLNTTSTLCYYGTLDATGDVGVANGVILEATSNVYCRLNATINGVIKGRFVVGNSVAKNSDVLISYRTRLYGADDGQHVFYVNGNLRVPYDMVNAAPYTAVAYVTGDVTLTAYNQPFVKIYEYKKHTEPRGAQYAVCQYVGGSAEDVGGVAMNKNYAVVYSKTALGNKADTGTTQYIDYTTLTSGSSLVNASIATHTLYVSCDTTVSGNIDTEGYVVLRSGVSLTIMGNLRCRGVTVVDDSTYAYVTNPSGLAGHYATDTVGATMQMQAVSVQGSFECLAERADMALSSNCVVRGNAVLHTTGIVTIDDSSIYGSLSAIGAAVRIGDYSAVGNSASSVITARTVRAENSSLNATIYATGANVQLLNTTISHVYAPAARVDIRWCGLSAYSGGAPTIVAAQLMAEDDMTFTGDIYLYDGTDASEFLYHPLAEHTVYTMDNSVHFLAGSDLSRANLIRSGGGNFLLNGEMPSSTLLDADSDEYTAMQETLDALVHPPTVAGVLSTAELQAFGIQSYDTVVRPAFSYVCNCVATKVEYTNLTNYPQFVVTDTDFWNPQAVPLNWVFPSGTANTAATVEGEKVALNNNADTSKLSVAYHSLSVWNTAGEYISMIWNNIKNSFTDNFNIAHPIASVRDSVLAAVQRISEDIISVSAVSRFAGISTKADSLYRFSASKYNDNIKPARTLSGGSLADVLVTSVCFLDGDSTIYNYIRDIEILSIDVGKMFTDWLDDAHPTLSKILKSLPMNSPRYVYRPCGVFFFNSGFVPAEVFNSYTDKSHDITKVSKPSSDKYRTNYTASERDSAKRWKWGSDDVTVSSSAADCTWTFFTCTDPSNPYGSAAKDLHIVLPKHTYMTWLADDENCVHIIGNGRVFLYLQEDTNIKIVGNYWTKTSSTDRQVFGGYRWVRTDGGKTHYTYTNGRPTSVTLDYALIGSRELQPRMFVIGTGPHISFEVQDFQLAAYVYMPNGSNYVTSDWSGTDKYNRFIVTNTAAPSYSSVTSDVYGIYVADILSTGEYASFKVNYHRTAVDLSDTTLYYGADLVTRKRANGRYRLAEFWDYPEGMPMSDLPWYYKGLQIQ